MSAKAKKRGERGRRDRGRKEEYITERQKKRPREREAPPP
jgi:hypothetical protein